MAATPVTPTAINATEVAVGGTPVDAILGGPNGGFLQNPSAPSDQGLADAEVLYVDPVGAAKSEANGTTFAIYPGGTWSVIPGQTTVTSVNAPSSGHKFSGIQY